MCPAGQYASGPLSSGPDVASGPDQVVHTQTFHGLSPPEAHPHPYKDPSRTFVGYLLPFHFFQAGSLAIIPFAAFRAALSSNPCVFMMNPVMDLSFSA